MPTDMHERGAAAQHPGGLEGISNGETLASEHRINTLPTSVCSLVVESLILSPITRA